MMDIDHEPEPLGYDCFIGVVLAPGGRQVAAVHPGKYRVGDCVLFSIAREAPHDCSVPGCPGPENKRRLEAFDELLAAAKRLQRGVIEEGYDNDPDDDAAIAKAEGR